jgi:hypothetical protein
METTYTEVKVVKTTIITTKTKQVAEHRPSPLTEREDQCQLSLKRFRTEAYLALQQSNPSIRAYHVFTNETMNALAIAAPKTTTELLAVKGMGPAKVEQFGAGILRAVAEAVVPLSHPVVSHKKGSGQENEPAANNQEFMQHSLNELRKMCEDRQLKPGSTKLKCIQRLLTSIDKKPAEQKKSSAGTKASALTAAEKEAAAMKREAAKKAAGVVKEAEKQAAALKKRAAKEAVAATKKAEKQAEKDAAALTKKAEKDAAAMLKKAEKEIAAATKKAAKQAEKDAAAAAKQAEKQAEKDSAAAKKKAAKQAEKQAEKDDGPSRRLGRKPVITDSDSDTDEGDAPAAKRPRPTTNTTNRASLPPKASSPIPPLQVAAAAKKKAAKQAEKQAEKDAAAAKKKATKQAENQAEKDAVAAISSEIAAATEKAAKKAEKDAAAAKKKAKKLAEKQAEKGAETDAAAIAKKAEKKAEKDAAAAARDETLLRTTEEHAKLTHLQLRRLCESFALPPGSTKHVCLDRLEAWKQKTFEGLSHAKLREFCGKRGVKPGSDKRICIKRLMVPNEAATVLIPRNNAVAAAPNRMRSEVEEHIGILPTTHWGDIRPERSCTEELRSNPIIRQRVPAVESIAADVEMKAMELKFGSSLPVALGDNELHAVVAYTHDTGQNKEQSLYFQLNSELRQRSPAGRQAMMSVWGLFVHYMLKAMSSLPDFQGVVYRGYPDKATTLAEYKYGRPIQWGAFTSTSTSLDATKEFTKQDTGVIFKITVSSGKDINPYSFFPNENEILLSPNHRFIVTSEPYEKDGYTIVDMLQQSGTAWLS